MEKVLEVIFDYACPFCYRIHNDLKELHRMYPYIQIKAIPCEAHPRPEQYGKYSDLCVMGMYFCEEHKINVWKYHDAIYKAIFIDKIDYDNVRELAKGLKSIFDGDEEMYQDFIKSLTEGHYQEQVLRNNRYAWEELGLPAVPSLCFEGKVIKAVPGVGITGKQIRAFVQEG